MRFNNSHPLVSQKKLLLEIILREIFVLTKKLLIVIYREKIIACCIFSQPYIDKIIR